MAIDYGAEIARTTRLVGAFRRSRELFGREAEVLELMQVRGRMCRAQVHDFLAAKGTDEAEAEIRAIVKEVLAVDLPVCEAKVRNFQRALEIYEKRGDEENVAKCYKYLQEWLALYEEDYALVAFRSLQHFANFMEWEKRDKDKVWKYSIDPFGDGGYTGANFGFFYYFNRMVLQKDIKFISKQYPTGYGKSYSNVVAISWLLGIDDANDVLVVLGNPSLVLTNTKGLVDMMTTERYSKVFPKFHKYHTDGGNVRESMFSVCRQKEGELTLAHSSKPLNVKIISKDTPVDGIRVKFLFLDDVCRSDDAGNNKSHEKDVNRFWNQWWKRNYNPDELYICAGGTAYSIYDILSVLKSYYSKGKVKHSPVNKYTTLSLDDSCAFVSVPALDPDTDESTYPQKYSTEEKRKIRDRDFRSFMAMEQQTPLPPETSPFYWDNLQTYDFIPEEGRSDCCWAAIDPVRVGGDNFAMPIFVKVGEMHYLKDCIYRNVEQEKVYQLIVDKIVQHHITQLVIERNTDTSLKKLLTDMLREQGVSFCTINEIYTYEKKDVRITNQQNLIKTQLVFPSRHLYANSSEMGKFMYDIVSFSWDLSKNQHDDSIDAVTIFCETLLRGRNNRYATVGTFKR